MKNLKDLNGNTIQNNETEETSSFLSNVGNFFSDLQDRLRFKNKGSSFNRSGYLLVTLVLGSVVILSSYYLNQTTVDNRSQASLDHVDIEVVVPSIEYQINQEYSIPIHINPNNNRVTGVDLMVSLGNSSAATITDIIPNAPWGTVAIEEIERDRARLVIIANCSNTDCTPTNSASQLATLVVTGSSSGGRTTISPSGTTASVLGEEFNYIGDLFDASIEIRDHSQPTPTPPIRITPFPTPENTPGATPSGPPATAPPPTEPPPTNSPPTDPPSSDQDLLPPTIRITNPANRSEIPRGSTLTFSADARDNVEVSRVIFSAYGATFCIETVSPYACEIKIKGKPRHEIKLKAEAIDAAGNSSEQEITVRASR